MAHLYAFCKGGDDEAGSHSFSLAGGRDPEGVVKQ
jgi:hypothetical protein